MSVAKPLPHDAAPLHVTGQARYVDDLPVPSDCLHLAFGQSPVARGEITALDLEAVWSAPGVVAVLTATDLPFANDVSPSVHDEPLLAEGEVFYLGQPVFVVAATSHLAARKAVRAARIEIAEASPVLTIDEALEAQSRFEDGPRVWSKGDVEAALSAAPKRIRGRLEIGGQEHFYLEGQAALALPQEGGDMVVHSSTQHPTEIQHKVAEALGRRYACGASGNAAHGRWLRRQGESGKRLGRGLRGGSRHGRGGPVKMRYDRDDDMIITGKRHDFRIEYDVGC